MRRQERNGFAFYLQILILLVVFLSVCAILLQVFAGSAVLSRNARKQNDATELCRSAAEAFAAAGTLEGTVKLLGAEDTALFSQGAQAAAQLCYNADLQPAADGCYTLTIEVKAVAAPAGSLAEASFAVTDENGTPCAALDTEKYLPAAQEGGGADAA